MTKKGNVVTPKSMNSSNMFALKGPVPVTLLLKLSILFVRLVPVTNNNNNNNNKTFIIQIKSDCSRDHSLRVNTTVDLSLRLVPSTVLCATCRRYNKYTRNGNNETHQLGNVLLMYHHNYSYNWL